MKMTNDDLREAIDYTSRRTGFAPVLIEKDYYCSLILNALYEDDNIRQHLIFKGGTLLAKGYFDFFRLSEDLDFAVVNDFCRERSNRRKVADVIRASVPTLLADLNLTEVSSFRGFNESRQYNGVFGYNSVVGPMETIKFEVGFRGDLMLPTSHIELATLIEHPLRQKRYFAGIPVHGLARDEAFAEKARAALSRKEPAIRDFFDIDAISRSGFDVLDDAFVELVCQKLRADPGAVLDLTIEKRKLLQDKIAQDLNPVLKSGHTFSLDLSWSILQQMALRMENRGYSS